MGKCQTRLAHFDKDDQDELHLKSTMDSSDSAEEAAAAAAPSALSIFHEDILLAILSFVADVPFEMTNTGRSPIDTHSSLTHTLPLVSKQFHRLTSGHDLYWKHALLRLVQKEPSLWEEGLKRVIFDTKCDELRTDIMERQRNRSMNRRGKRTKNEQLHDEQQQADPQSVEDSKESNSDSDMNSSLSKEEQLLQEACTVIESHPPHHHTASPSGIYQCLYQSILLRHLRYRAPVFYMHSTIKIGQPYGLHFFEPRYRVLISEVMAPYPISARRGDSIIPVIPGLFPPQRDRVMDDETKNSILTLLEKNESILRDYHLPTFIHAHENLRRNAPATIVQVMRSMIQPDGSADVFLRPIGYIWLEEIWERPGTGGLYEARGIRMGKDAGDSYEMMKNMRAFGRGDGRGWGQMLPIP